MPLSKVHLGIGQMNILVYLVILFALGQVTSLVDRFHSSEETPPSFHFAVLDEETGKICILAKFDASFIITYDTKYGKQQMIDRLTAQPEVDGRCPSLLDEQPVMDISWRGGFTFRLIFTKNPFENTWKIETLDLVYNTGDSLFRDSVGGKETLAKSKSLALAAFETSLDKSYFCPTTPTLTLYDTKTGEANVLVRMFNVQIQAFKVKGAKFSPIQHCGQVGFGTGVSSPLLHSPDDGVIVITFSIYIFMSIATVLGYAGYRTWFVKRQADYGKFYEGALGGYESVGGPVPPYQATTMMDTTPYQQSTPSVGYAEYSSDTSGYIASGATGYVASGTGAI